MNTKKLLGFAILTLEALFVLYLIRMVYGLEQMIRVLATTGTMLGILGLCAVFVIAVSLISGESDDPSDYFDP